MAVDGNDWDPTDPESGNGWENQALFDFDGNALPALLEFQGKRSHSSTGMVGVSNQRQ